MGQLCLCLGLVEEATLGRSISLQRVTVPITLAASGTHFYVQAFLEGILLHQSLVTQYQIPVVEQEKSTSMASVKS